MKIFDNNFYSGLRVAEMHTATIIHWPRKPDGIVVHYAYCDWDCSAAEVNEWHRNRGFQPRGSGPYPYMGYHKLIRMDGSVEVGRTDDVIGTHCLGHNDHTFGICLSGGLQPTGWPTEAQYRSLEIEVRHYMERYGIPVSRIYRHDQLQPTSCPGRFSLERLRQALSRPATLPPTTKKEVETVRLEFDRKEGNNLVYEFCLPLKPEDLIALDADVPAHDVEVAVYAKPIVGELMYTKTRIGGYGNRDQVHGLLTYVRQLFPTLPGAAWVTVHSPVPLHGGVLA